MDKEILPGKDGGFLPSLRLTPPTFREIQLPVAGQIGRFIARMILFSEIANWEAEKAQRKPPDLGGVMIDNISNRITDRALHQISYAVVQLVVNIKRAVKSKAYA